LLQQPQLLFPNVDASFAHFPSVGPAERDDYTDFVIKQLRANRVKLFSKIRAGGAVFGRRKPSGRIRALWNGKRISEAVLPPPKPPHLASPTALLALQTTADKPFLFSKRDGQVMFDQLRLPSALRPYLAQPAVSVADLVSRGGFTRDELWSYIDDLDGGALPERLWPASTVWCMGFAWSSYVCQATTLTACRRGGIDDDLFLADDKLPPTSCTDGVAVATDDIGLLTSRGADAAVDLAAGVGRGLAAIGVVQNADKAVTAVRNGTIIGLDLDEGFWLAPSRDKLLRWTAAVVALLGRPQCSPRQLSALLGQPRWHFQLNRPLYALFLDVYDFARAEPLHVPRTLPPSCRAELLAALMLSPWTEADLTRPWATTLLATDASPSFGFGLSARSVTPHQSREVGRQACSVDAVVRFDLAASDEPEKVRLGTEYRLPFPMGSFRTVLSARTRFGGHAGHLEATGVNLAAKHIARRPALHQTRIPRLIDAQAVLNAFRKGRSSAGTIRYVVRRTAMYFILSDVLMTFLYVPSESNPADAPSRGRARAYTRARM